MKFRIEDNSDKFMLAVEERTKKAFQIIGGQMVTNAKTNLTNFMWQHKTEDKKGDSYHAAIDTGLLRNSITYAVSGEPAAISSYTADRGGRTGAYSGTAPVETNSVAVHVGTNVEYSDYIENGTRSIPAVHYLANAVSEHRDEYEKILVKMLTDELSK